MCAAPAVRSTDTMAGTNTQTISLTRGWNDWHWANAPLNVLRDIHWHRPTGAPRPIVHAYISCDDIADGELSHQCCAASAPHRLLVCVLRRRNLPTAYAQIAQQADQMRSTR